MNIFDILGPVMVGPSSSHTAGGDKDRLYYKKGCWGAARKKQGSD